MLEHGKHDNLGYDKQNVKKTSFDVSLDFEASTWTLSPSTA
ncbi:hypothetical protein RMSM_00885 [Rhodopirellula maiorica SM1]|uniref:Uncharacterized protein n=1 Tax=Rhodopirellula maiorica SM1 TaxID=1265738 RepID=M5S3I5_9BACT|nr:hypothetical protein RMSM_00885 [Rhodopirellula maiorica SM1]